MIRCDCGLCLWFAIYISVVKVWCLLIFCFKQSISKCCVRMPGGSFQVDSPIVWKAFNQRGKSLHSGSLNHLPSQDIWQFIDTSCYTHTHTTHSWSKFHSLATRATLVITFIALMINRMACRYNFLAHKNTSVRPLFCFDKRAPLHLPVNQNHFVGSDKWLG